MCERDMTGGKGDGVECMMSDDMRLILRVEAGRLQVNIKMRHG